MTTVTLGKTGITVNKNGFGALPIQRVNMDEAVRLLHKAFAHGVDFYDTARMYTDSEEKLGQAFADRRDKIFIASKTMATTGDKMREELEQSLRLLGTDHLDIYQFHNPAFCPKPDDGSGLYEAAAQAKSEGLIRHIGITNHRLSVAHEAIDSGLYDTLQFPLSYLSTSKDLELVARCKEEGMGFIAMKGMSGGLITNAAASYAYMSQFDNVLPIWGVQREEELDAFLRCQDDEPSLEAMLPIIEADRAQLAGEFCRGCGYCLPCPAEINIPMAARMMWFIRRMPTEPLLDEGTQQMMARIEQCIHCDQCASRCPYDLETPRLLEESWRDYQEILAGKSVEAAR